VNAVCFVGFSLQAGRLVAENRFQMIEGDLSGRLESLARYLIQHKIPFATLAPCERPRETFAESLSNNYWHLHGGIHIDPRRVSSVQIVGILDDEWAWAAVTGIIDWLNVNSIFVTPGVARDLCGERENRQWECARMLQLLLHWYGIPSREAAEVFPDLFYRLHKTLAHR